MAHGDTKIVRNGGVFAEADAVPAVTMGSFLVCRHGGLIEPVTSGRENRETAPKVLGRDSVNATKNVRLDYSVLSNALKNIEGITDTSGKKVDIINDFETYRNIINKKNEKIITGNKHTASIALSDTVKVKAKLYGVMADMYRIYKETDNNDSAFYSKMASVGDDNLNSLILTVNSLIKDYGMDETVHYFRNVMNALSDAPKDLDGMIVLAHNGDWKLAKISDSAYHMQGTYGKYNLKFTSANGFFEAVYSKEGKLLTGSTDPENMGTYNYSPYGDSTADHITYDVDPYYRWGNVGETPAYIPKSYSNDPEAVRYWKNAERRIKEGK
jgi:hypothetical protein